MLFTNKTRRHNSTHKTLQESASHKNPLSTIFLRSVVHNGLLWMDLETAALLAYSEDNPSYMSHPFCPR